MRRLGVLVVAVLVACGDAGPAAGPGAAGHPETVAVPAGAPVRELRLRLPGSAAVRTVRYAEVDGWAVVEGDIVVARVADLQRDASALGVVTSEAGKRWPGGTVAYTVAADLPSPERVTQAIAHWEERTNVRFVPRTAQNAAYFPGWVHFQPGTGCSAYIGAWSEGGSPVTLDVACDVGSTIHEIGHALGMWHEQSREDRDAHVRILWENIQDGQAHNFDQHVADGEDVGAYDYGSIMHYGTHYWSKNGLPTIEVLSGQTIGNRTVLSTGDIATARFMYPTAATLPPLASFTVTSSGTTATFTSTSVDPDGTIAAYLWDFGDGTTSTLARPSHTYPAPGRYFARLTVTDSAGASSAGAWQEFLVGTQAPVPDFTFAVSGSTVAFTDRSTDPDGTIATRQWSFGEMMGPAVTAVNPTYTYRSYGTFEVNLRVADNWGVDASVMKRVRIEPPGGVLQNSVDATELAAATGATLTYTLVLPAGATNLSVSTSEGTGDVSLYLKHGSAPTTTSYDCRSVQAGNAESCLVGTPAAGTWYIVLRATQAFSGVRLSPWFRPPTNNPPTAAFSATTSGLTATFTDASTDGDGTVTSRSWDFGDGTSSSDVSPTKTYAAAGTYRVTLTVWDDAGAPATAERDVTVTSGSVLQNGVPVTGLALAKGAVRDFTLVVPAGQSTLTIATSGGTGDADLYVRRGSAPTTSTYDCRPYKTGNAETCTFTSPVAGTYYVQVRAYQAVSGLTLQGSYAAAGPSFFENTTDVAIRDNATVESALAVSGRTGNAPSTLKVAVNIRHTYQGDLRVELVAPNGSLFTLWNRAGGSTDNLVQTFTVNASAVPANGTWRLRVNDNASGDTGTLDAWSLQF